MIVNWITTLLSQEYKDNDNIQSPRIIAHMVILTMPMIIGDLLLTNKKSTLAVQ